MNPHPPAWVVAARRRVRRALERAEVRSDQDLEDRPPDAVDEDHRCKATFKTPTPSYYQCRFQPHDPTKHPHEPFGPVYWSGTADMKTESCGTKNCPGGKRA